MIAALLLAATAAMAESPQAAVSRMVGDLASNLEAPPDPVDARVEQAREAAARGDILAWGHAVAPAKFYRPPCRELHGYFVEIRKDELTSTVAPRGHAKTFIKCCIIPLFQALEESAAFDYYLNVQATNKKGVALNFAIKYEVETNPVLRALYGEQVGDVKWTDEQFMLRNGVVFQGAGVGDSIKGMQFLNRRPKYTVVDDLYDEEDIGNPERIQAKNDWFWGSLYPTRARGLGTAFHIQGTVVGSNDLMLKLGEMAQTDKQIKHKEFAAYDPATRKVLWPELNTIAELETERERMGSAIFDREMQGTRRSAGDSIVSDAWLEGWEYDPDQKWGKLIVMGDVRAVGAKLGFDPSTGKDEGDPCAGAVVVKTLGPGTRYDYWIEDLFEGSLSFDGRLAKLESMQAQHHARLSDPAFRIRKAYVESIGGFADFGNAAKNKTGLPVELVTWVKGKVANLSAKSGHFEFGRVHISKRIPKPLRDKLKDQLTTNTPPHDDVRDAVLLTLEDATKPSMRDWV